MTGLRSCGLCRSLAGGAAVGALWLAGPAVAQAPGQEPISPYICLSNSCVMPGAADAAGSGPGRQGVRAPAPPAAPARARASAPTPQMLQQMQATLAARMFENLTDEQRATARVTPTIDGDRVTLRVDYQNPDGTRGARTVSVNMGAVLGGG